MTRTLLVVVTVVSCACGDISLPVSLPLPPLLEHAGGPSAVNVGWAHTRLEGQAFARVHTLGEGGFVTLGVGVRSAQDAGAPLLVQRWDEHGGALWKTELEHPGSGLVFGDIDVDSSGDIALSFGPRCAEVACVHGSWNGQAITGPSLLRLSAAGEPLSLWTGPADYPANVYFVGGGDVLAEQTSYHVGAPELFRVSAAGVPLEHHTWPAQLADASGRVGAGFGWAEAGAAGAKYGKASHELTSLWVRELDPAVSGVVRVAGTDAAFVMLAIAPGEVEWGGAGFPPDAVNHWLLLAADGSGAPRWGQRFPHRSTFGVLPGGGVVVASPDDGCGAIRLTWWSAGGTQLGAASFPSDCDASRIAGVSDLSVASSSGVLVAVTTVSEPQMHSHLVQFALGSAEGR